MAQRKSRSKRFDSSAVQGEGSYIELRQVRIGEVRDLIRATQVDDRNRADEIDLAAREFAKVVTGWNWVDDDGNELPSPAGNPAVFDDLTTEEWAFIAEQFKSMVNPSADEATKKN